MVSGLLLPRPAAAVDGCLVMLCFAAPNWRAIPRCVPPIRQVLRDLARGKAFPTCAMAGVGQFGPQRLGAGASLLPAAVHPSVLRRRRPGGCIATTPARAVGLRQRNTVFPHLVERLRRIGDGVHPSCKDTARRLEHPVRHRLRELAVSAATGGCRGLEPLRPEMDGTLFLALVLRCAPQVDAGTAQALVTVESGLQP